MKKTKKTKKEVHCKKCEYLGPDMLCKSPEPPHEVNVRIKNKNKNCKEYKAKKK